MTEAWLPRRLLYAPLEVLNASAADDSDAAPEDRGVPTSHPLLHASAYDRLQALRTAHSSHASHAATCVLGGSRNFPSAFVLARAIEDATILELRWLRLTAPSNDALHDESHAAVLAAALEEQGTASHIERFAFPAPLLPSIHIFADHLSDSLQVIATTVTGYMFRLQFHLPDLFHAKSFQSGWATEHRISAVAGVDERGRWMSGRMLASVNAANASLLVATCDDGSVVKIEQGRNAHSGRFEGDWEETFLQTTSALRNLARYFGRPSAPSVPKMNRSDVESNSPLQALSIATFQSESYSPFAFVITRDKKLRIWDLITDSCVRTMDLPTSASSTEDSDALVLNKGEGSSASTALFAPDARPLMRVVPADAEENSKHSVSLVVHIPASATAGAFFIYYGLELGVIPTGATSSPLGDIVRLWDAYCDVDTRGSDLELRDIAVLPYGAAGLRLWGLWDDSGSPFVKYTHLVEDQPEGDSSYLSLPASSGPASWITISDWRPYSPLHGPLLEASAALRGESREDLADFFLDRIFESARFNEHSLTSALTRYEDLVLQSLGSDALIPPALSPDTDFLTLRHHLAEVVGCTVTLEVDPTVGNLLAAQYLSALKREWMRFIGLIESFETSARWPLALVAPHMPKSRSHIQSPLSAQPLVLTRDYLVGLSVEDAASAFHRIASQINQGSSTRAGPRSVALARIAAVEQAFITGTGQGAAVCRSILSPIVDASADQGISLLNILETGISLLENTPTDRVDAFFATLQENLSTRLSTSIEDMVSDVWSNLLEEVVGPDAFQFLSESCTELGDALEETLLQWTDLLLEGLEAPSSSRGGGIETELESVFLSDSLATIVRARRASARVLTFILTSIWVSNGLERGVPSLPSLLARSVSIAHSCDAILGIADLEGRPLDANLPKALGETDNPDAVMDQLARLGMSTDAPGVDLSGPAISPLHFAITKQLFKSLHVANNDDDSAISIDVNLTANALLIFSQVTEQMLEEYTSSLPTMSPTLARVANGLVASGFSSAAERILTSVPPSVSGSYLAGSLALLRREPDAAKESFDKVIRALHTFDILVADDDGLLDILPASVTAALPDDAAIALLCRHISSIAGQLNLVLVQAYYGAESLRCGLRAGTWLDAELVRETRFSTFRAQLQLGNFKAAYRSIMSSTDDGFKRDCARSLVTAMCEAGEVSQLLHFNFAGLQIEIERTLSFKARNSNPFARPSYFKILYAYHMHRGDLKSAGAVMYQQSHQLSDLQRMGYHLVARPSGAEYEEFEDIGSVQARSFLAAMNVLNLVDSKDAWFAHAIAPAAAKRSGTNADEMETDSVAPEARVEESFFAEGTAPVHSSKSSRTTNYIPDSEFAAGTRDLEIVRLEDIKKEYQLLLARLDLARGYPELAAAQTKLNAADAVALYLRSDQYDAASTTARALQVDMAPVFRHLTTKCIALTRRAAARRREVAEDSEKGEAHPQLMELLDEIDGQEDPDATFLLHSDRIQAYLRKEEQLVGKQTRAAASPAEKAWAYLRMQLELNDTAQNGWRYHAVVLDRALDLGAGDGPQQSAGEGTTPKELPPWLLQWFRANRPDQLIRSWFRVGHLQEALQETVAVLKKPLVSSMRTQSLAEASGAAAAQEPYIPYTLIDEMLAVSEEAEALAGARMELRTLAQEVRRATEERIGKLERSERERRKAEAHTAAAAATASFGTTGRMANGPSASASGATEGVVPSDSFRFGAV